MSLAADTADPIPWRVDGAANILHRVGDLRPMQTVQQRLAAEIAVVEDLEGARVPGGDDGPLGGFRVPLLGEPDDFGQFSEFIGVLHHERVPRRHEECPPCFVRAPRYVPSERRRDPHVHLAEPAVVWHREGAGNDRVVRVVQGDLHEKIGLVDGGRIISVFCLERGRASLMGDGGMGLTLVNRFARSS